MIHPDARRLLALQLLETEAIRRKHQSSDGEGFRLKLHDKYPDAPLSPIYVDLRRLRSFPDTMDLVIYAFLRLIQNLKFDVLADVPTAATVFAAILSHQLRLPMVTPREPKTHGAGGNIDGHVTPGQTALLIDDLITKADSKLEAIRTLEARELHVRDIAVLIDREQGGTRALQRAGYALHAAFTLRELLDFYVREGLMSRGEYEEIQTYLANA